MRVSMLPLERRYNLTSFLPEPPGPLCQLAVPQILAEEISEKTGADADILVPGFGQKQFS